ncbi:MAG: hypothetical protein LAO79_02835 [Acidobacteriia bacterium]|nr:hypothetical protein [Terriglobia bacterium]
MLFNEDRRKNRDRRSAPRAPASGRVSLSFANPAPVTVEAEWIETSASGFRLAHNSNAIEPGLEVFYESDGKRGRARVIWTHVLVGRHVSGFVEL